MSVSSLTRIMPPPQVPLEGGNNSMWEGVEKAIGIALPDDYKAYINAYGTGIVGDFVLIFNPFSSNEHLNLKFQLNYVLANLKSVRSKFSRSEAYPIYPEEGGIFPCGVTDNGDFLFWETVGEPNCWPLVICMKIGPAPREKHRHTLTDFLEKLLENEIESEYISEPPFDRQARFKPRS